jgi:hypothetical protein
MNKKLVWGAVVVLVIVVAAVILHKPKSTYDQSSSDSRERLTWDIKEVTPGDGMNPPTNKVTLVAGAGGPTYDLGTHDGTCATVEGSSWALLSGERTGVICYFAGAGTELGVFDEKGKLVVKQGVLEEGDAETAGTRGNFTTVLELQ